MGGREEQWSADSPSEERGREGGWFREGREIVGAAKSSFFEGKKEQWLSHLLPRHGVASPFCFCCLRFPPPVASPAAWLSAAASLPHPLSPPHPPHPVSSQSPRHDSLPSVCQLLAFCMEEGRPRRRACLADERPWSFETHGSRSTHTPKLTRVAFLQPGTHKPSLVAFLPPRPMVARCCYAHPLLW